MRVKTSGMRIEPERSHEREERSEQDAQPACDLDQHDHGCRSVSTS
jgi:hypothetical protein